VESFKIALYLIFTREDLEQRYPTGEIHELRKTPPDFVGSKIMQDIRTDDQIKGAVEPMFVQLPKASQAEIPPSAEAPDSVLTRIDSPIGDLGPNRVQRRLPPPLPASHIEDAPEGAIQDRLGDSHRECHGS
jgi:hypothetical protein